ncbi:MAG: flagellar hook-length control protein FliK [Thalassovita sp.]
MKIAFPVPVLGAPATAEASGVLVAEGNALLFGDVFETLLVPKDKLIEPETTEGHGEIEQTDDSTGSAVQETQPEEALSTPIDQQRRNQASAGAVFTNSAHSSDVPKNVSSTPIATYAAPLAPGLIDLRDSGSVAQVSMPNVMTQLASYALQQPSLDQAPGPENSTPIRQDIRAREPLAKPDGSALNAESKAEISHPPVQPLAITPRVASEMLDTPDVTQPQRAIETAPNASAEIPPLKDAPRTQSNFVAFDPTQGSSVAEREQPIKGTQINPLHFDDSVTRAPIEETVISVQNIEPKQKFATPVEAGQALGSHHLKTQIDRSVSESSPLPSFTSVGTMPIQQPEQSSAPVKVEVVKNIETPRGAEIAKTGVQTSQWVAPMNPEVAELNPPMATEISTQAAAPTELSHDQILPPLRSNIAMDPPAQMMSPMSNGPELAVAAPMNVAPSPAFSKAVAETEAIENALALEPGAPRTQGAPPAQSVAKPNPVPQIIPHLADLSVARGDKIEITLSPDELGRVRLAATQTENGVVLVVQAERPETLDLMRRHMSDLLNDLQDMGFADINYSDGQQQDQSKTDAPQATAELMETSETTSQTQMLAQGGLDLRL